MSLNGLNKINPNYIIKNYKEEESTKSPIIIAVLIIITIAFLVVVSSAWLDSKYEIKPNVVSEQSEQTKTALAFHNQRIIHNLLFRR